MKRRISSLLLCLVMVTAVFTVVVPVNVMTSSSEEGLVGYWNFDEGFGTIAHDSSGNDNHGTFSGDPQWVDGVKGGALEFDGNYDWVEIGHSQILKPATQITFSAWVKLYYNYEAVYIVSGYYSDRVGGFALCPHMYMKDFYSSVYTTSGWVNVNYDSFKPVSQDIWYFLACTYDGTIAKLYINGMKVDELPISGDLKYSSNPFRIGTKSNYQRIYDVNGVIDEVRVYNRALNSMEIWRVYNSVFPKLPDLSIMTEDITFSNPNPEIGETITIKADIHNLGFTNTWIEYPGNPLSSSLPMTGPSVLFDGSIYHMWYHNYPYGKNICYANSSDGVTWNEYSGNPLFGSNNVIAPFVMFKDGEYKMWYTKQIGSTDFIHYATSPDGVTWTQYLGNPVLSLGNSGEWDDTYLDHPTVLFDEGEYKMWYVGTKAYFGYGIGYANSTDGINWHKYDNPATTNPPYQYSDPVFTTGPSGTWDYNALAEPMVIKEGDTYLMWYVGTHDQSIWRIGFASSGDGINWIKSADNPIFDVKAGTWYSKYVTSPSILKIDNTLKMWYNGWDGSAYRIGLATLDPTTTATVFFYDGNPDNGGNEIGHDDIVVWGNLPADASIDWTPAEGGTYDIYVKIENVEPDDADWSNNIASKSITVLPIAATIDIDPDTINLDSQGKWITCYIDLPEGYNEQFIDFSTIKITTINDEPQDIRPVRGAIEFEPGGEYGEFDTRCMAKFDRPEVQGLLSPGTYVFKVEGKLLDGTLFEGLSDEITVIDPP